MINQRLTTMRIEKQTKLLNEDPITNVLICRDGKLNFHFLFYKMQQPYSQGYYHGVLQLPQNYPFSAPKLKFFTPNGRFIVNQYICTSYTNFHQESWTSAWSIRTLILATISFMNSNQNSYGVQNQHLNVRKNLALKSLEWNKKNPEFMRIFRNKLQSIGIYQNESLIENNPNQPLIENDSLPQNGHRKCKIALCFLAVTISITIVYLLL